MKYFVILVFWILIVVQVYNVFCGVYVLRLGRIEGLSDFKMYLFVDIFVYRKFFLSVSLFFCFDFVDNDFIVCSFLYVNWRVFKNWNFCCYICVLLVFRNGQCCLLYFFDKLR